MNDRTEREHHLVCAECGATSPPHAKGWRGYITIHGDAVMFCPICAEREFQDDPSGDEDRERPGTDDDSTVD